MPEGLFFVCCIGYKNINSLSKEIRRWIFLVEGFILQVEIKWRWEKYLFTREVPLLRSN